MNQAEYSNLLLSLIAHPHHSTFQTREYCKLIIRYYGTVNLKRSFNVIDGKIFINLDGYQQDDELVMEDGLFQVVDKFNNALLVNKV
jgi:hypothetical protein